MESYIITSALRCRAEQEFSEQLGPSIHKTKALSRSSPEKFTRTSPKTQEDKFLEYLSGFKKEDGQNSDILLPIFRVETVQDSVTLLLDTSFGGPGDTGLASIVASCLVVRHGLKVGSKASCHVRSSLKTDACWMCVSWIWLLTKAAHRHYSGVQQISSLPAIGRECRRAHPLKRASVMALVALAHWC